MSTETKTRETVIGVFFAPGDEADGPKDEAARIDGDVVIDPPGSGPGIFLAPDLDRLERDVDAKAAKSDKDIAHLEECWGTMHRRMEILERSVWRKPNWWPW